MGVWTITALGQCGFLLDDGHTRLVTDPYLSDAVDQMYNQPGSIWHRQYPAPCTLASLQPNGVLISHAHTDHMDPITLSEYAKSGGEAIIAAPAPEADRLQEMGIQRAYYARAEQTFEVGSVKITPIACAHTELHLDAQGRFRELSYVIESGGRRVFFGGDLCLYDGLVERLRRARCDVYLLPVNGRDAERTSHGIIGNMNEKEAAAFAAALDAPFIPMHHDLYAGNGCPIDEVERAAQAYGARMIRLDVGECWTME